MFSGFQGNAFQRNAFQINGSITPAPVVLRDGGIPDHYKKKYLKYLETLKKLKPYKEYSEKAVSAALEIIEDIPLEIPQIEMIADKERGINIEALSREISKIEEYINAYNFMEQDDELAILLMMS